MSIILVIFFLCLYLLGYTLQNGYPRNYLDANVAFYIAKIKMILRNHNLYTESWYFGYEMLKYYPPLSTYIPTFFAVVTGELLLSYYFLCFFFYAIFCVGIYMFISHFFESRLAGLFSGVLWVFTHINFISFQGLYWETCRLMGTAAVPWVLYFTHKRLKEGKKIDLFMGILLSSYCLLSNLFSAIDLVVLVAPYLLLNLFPSRTLGEADDSPQHFRGLKVLTSFLIGVSAFTLWWYIPAIIPHGFGAYLTGGSNYTPLIIETFLQPFPPNYMPAIQLPLTVLGSIGMALGVAKQSREGFLIFTSFLVSILFAYVIKIQSQRITLLFGLCLVFGAGYLMKEIHMMLTKRYPSSSCRIAVGLLLPLVFLGYLYLPRYQPPAVVDDTYLSSDEYIVSTWLAQNSVPDFRAYLMWGDSFRGSQWVNAFYPEVKQVLGGYDQGARVESDAPFVFDYLVKWSDNASELHRMSVDYHVKYIAIDKIFMEPQGSAYEKFRDTMFFKPIEDLNGRLRYASVYEVLNVSPIQGEPPDSLSEYHYWSFWKEVGFLVSCILIPFFGFFIRSLNLRNEGGNI